MKNLSCYIMAISTLLFACSSESEDGGSGTGGASSDDGAGGAETPAGTGGSSPASSAGANGTAGSPGSAAGAAAATPADAVGESGVAAATLVSDLGVDELDKLCIFMESTVELVRGATSDELYASGTWNIPECPVTREVVDLWASPALCVRGLAEGRGESLEVGCSTLSVAKFETCFEGIAAGGLPDSLCQLDDLDECLDLDTCYPDLIH